jgi:ABC-type iron transport system FetAB ATPase subunit
MTALRLDGIRSHALGPLHLQVEAGELVFVSGPSGSGKSLLLRAIADLDPHDGEVWLGAEPRSRILPSVWRRRVGLLPAEAFWWAETVGAHLPTDLREPVHAPPHLLRARVLSRLRPSAPRVSDRPHADPAALTEWIVQLGFAPDVLGWSVARLSTGERQRLALIRLLAQSPEVLLLDEATANLDPTNGARVEAVVETYRETRSAAVLWVSHDPGQRRRIGGRSLVIRDQRLEPET